MDDDTVSIPLLETPARTAELLRIAPPPSTDSKSLTTQPLPLPLLDPSLWLDKDVVWSGSLVVLEKENLSLGTIKGVIRYINGDGTVFGETEFNPLDQIDLLRTRSKWKYRILIDHQDKKIALGLVFKDGNVLANFDDTLRRLLKDVQLGQEDKIVERMQQLSVDTVREIHSEEDSSDDEFGEFVN